MLLLVHFHNVYSQTADHCPKIYSPFYHTFLSIYLICSTASVKLVVCASRHVTAQPPSVTDNNKFSRFCCDTDFALQACFKSTFVY